MARQTILTKFGDWAIDDRQWVAQGGEADIYKRDKYAIKLYKDPAQAVARGLVQRVEFAQQWSGLNVAAPVDVAYSKKREPIGIILPWVEGAPLLTAFNNEWRTQHQFDAIRTEQVTAAMMGIVASVHTSKALMVDGNEWNYLLDAQYRPWAIDADSWAIPGFPATARMPSIEDVHTSGVNAGSDWFAWAVVTFQLWTGIHPYKGSHPDFKKGDMRSRMQKNVSVFHSDVRTPSTVRSLDAIPAALRQWYREVFESGLRDAPPAAVKWKAAPVIAPVFRAKPLATSGQNVTLKLLQQGRMEVRGDALWDGSRWLRWDGRVISGAYPTPDACSVWLWEAWPDQFLALQKLQDGWRIVGVDGASQDRLGIDTVWMQNGVLFAASSVAVEQWAAQKMGDSGWRIHAPWRWTCGDNWRQANNVRHWMALGGTCALWTNGTTARIARFKELDGRRIRNWRQEGAYALAVVEEGDGLELWVWTPDQPQLGITKHAVDDADINAAHVGQMLMYWTDDGEGYIRGTHASEPLRGPVHKVDAITGWRNKFIGLNNDGIVQLSKST